MGSHTRSWAFESPSKLLDLLNDDAIWTRAALKHDAEITLLTAIAQAAIVAPIEAAEPEGANQHAGDMNRTDDQIERLRTWMKEKITPQTPEERGGRLFGKIRHGFREDKDLFKDRERCVDLWLSTKEMKEFIPLTEMKPNWKRRTLYRQMRNALSHSMVFMRGHPAIQEIVLCPKANNAENDMRRRDYKEEMARYKEAKKEHSECKANRDQDPTNNTEEQEAPAEPAPLQLTCDCLVFPIETFKDLLRHWLEFFVAYREDLGILTGRDLFDDYGDDFEAA